MRKLIIVHFFFYSSIVNAGYLELGGGINTSYEGEFPVYSDSKEKMEYLAMPISLSLILDNLRVSYIDYKQVAKGSSSSTSSHAKVENNILSFNYAGSIEFNNSAINYFAGIGLFRSHYEVNYNRITTDDYAINIIGNSSKDIDPGLISGIGYVQNIDKGFIGLNLTYIPSKNITYKYNWINEKYYISSWSDLETVNVGGNIIYLITGFYFWFVILKINF